MESWSGLGVGTDRQSFLEAISNQLPEFDPREAAEAVVCSLSERVSSGTAERLFEQLPPDVRSLFELCQRRGAAHGQKGDGDDFYLGVAEHLMVEVDQVRRVLHAVFAALHGQITERESERIASELPADLESTWIAARHNVPAPR